MLCVCVFALVFVFVYYCVLCGYVCLLVVGGLGCYFYYFDDVCLVGWFSDVFVSALFWYCLAFTCSMILCCLRIVFGCCFVVCFGCWLLFNSVVIAEVNIVFYCLVAWIMMRLALLLTVFMVYWYVSYCEFVWFLVCLLFVCLDYCRSVVCV